MSSARFGIQCRRRVCTLLLSVLGGCAGGDPQPDYQRSADLIAQRTGAAEVFTPDASERTEQRVAELLQGGLTVGEAAQVALLNNRGFQSLVAEIGASRADVAQSALLTNPTLSLRLQFPEGGGLTDLTVGFAAQLADLWQIPIRRQLAEADLERTIYAVGQRAVELVAEVRARCYRVLALEAALTYTQENLRLVQRAVALSDAQFQAGEVSAFDVNLARTGALDVQEELIATRGLLEAARVDLAQALGLSARIDAVRLADSLPAAVQSWPGTDVLLDLALDERFDVRVAWFAVQRAEAALRLECRKFLPDVQLGFAFERGEQRALPERKILADTARASIAAGQLAAPTIQSRGQRDIERSQIIEAKLGPTLALALPIFDQNQARIAKARVRVLQARKEYEARVETVAADIQRAAAGARTAAEMLEFQQTRGLTQAQATVDGAERRYEAGEEGVLVLIEAQDSLVRRRRAYANTLRDYAVALAQLEGAVGGHALLARRESPATQPAEER
ncbi:Outer membrane efflux protein [Phycisphaerae bacterium RAS1]|nr:Outer membrane efflux protein [Phycisphaerae bacterium RAS1]